MSQFDIPRISRYPVGRDEANAIMDVLENLKAQLEQEQEALEKAALAVKQLRLAITAIERDAAAQARAIATQKPTRKRGELSRAVLDCVRGGIGTVALIQKTLEQRGVVASGQSISNSIQRLQAKKLIVFHPQRLLWILDDQGESYPRHEDADRNDTVPH